MKLYKVTTTFLGADCNSSFYFDAIDKAEKFLNECENGEIKSVKVSYTPWDMDEEKYIECELNYSDGCTLNDLCCGDFTAVREIEI